MSENKEKLKNRRLARQRRTRIHIRRNSKRPRLVVFRSNKHIYAQLIDDKTQNTVVGSSTLEKSFKELEKPLTGVDAAKWVGQDVARKALAKNVAEVIFDRGRYLYHGRVKALADAAREQGLVF